MATMNISLPDQMKDWVEAQTQDGRYSNSSDYIRDLIRRDQIKREKIAKMDELIAEGLASGIETRSMDQILDDVRRRRQPSSDAA